MGKLSGKGKGLGLFRDSVIDDVEASIDKASRKTIVETRITVYSSPGVTSFGSGFSPLLPR